MEKVLYHYAPGKNGVERTFYRSRVAKAIIGADGKYINCNEAFGSFFGYTPQELIGTNFRRYTHPDDLEAQERNINDLLSRRNGQEHYEMAKRYLHKVNGTAVWFEVCVDAIWIPNPNGDGDIFSHFFMVALPYVDTGGYRVENRDGKIVARPTLSVADFAKDNIWFVITFFSTLFLFHPDISKLILQLLLKMHE